MNPNCSKCNTLNPPDAQFCQACGTMLGVTTNQGRTVVAPIPAVPLHMSDEQVKTIVQRAENAFGNATIACDPSQWDRSRITQREHLASVVDKSDSMGGQCDSRYNKIQAAIRANTTMVLHKAQIDPNDEVGIVAFNSHADILLPLRPIHSHKRQIIETLQSLDHDNGTDINEGLKKARDLFDWSRNDVVRRIVLLTDGQGGHPLNTAEDLKSRGVVIDVIGVGDTPSEVDEKLLRKVASVIQGETRYRFIKDQQTLVAHYTQLANKTATSAQGAA